MIDHVTWRSACFIYAALHLFVMLPLQVTVVRTPGKIKSEGSGQNSSRGTSRIDNETLIFTLLAVVLSIAAGIGRARVCPLFDPLLTQSGHMTKLVKADHSQKLNTIECDAFHICNNLGWQKAT